MAKKDRNKRAARKARQEQRKLAEATATAPSKSTKAASKPVEKSDSTQSAPATTPASPQKKSHVAALQKKAQTTTKSKQAKKPKKSIFKKVLAYFSGVRQELKRVVWPTRKQLVRLSIAVFCILIVVGFCIWALDTGSSNVMLKFVQTFEVATNG